MSLSLASWIIYLAVGKLFIFLFQQFPLPSFLEKRNTIRKFHNCGMCSGTWVYSILAWAMGISLLEVLGFHYVPLVSEIVTGGVVSFIVHLLNLGWNDQFAVEIN